MGNDMECGCFFLLLCGDAVFLLVYPLTQWQAEQSPGDGWVGSRCLASVYEGFQNNFAFPGLHACAVRIWKSGTKFPLRPRIRQSLSL